jgi:hypothetical protein
MDRRIENDEISILCAHFFPIPMRPCKDFYINCPSLEQDRRSRRQLRAAVSQGEHVGPDKNILALIRHFYSIMRKKYDTRKKKNQNGIDM